MSTTGTNVFTVSRDDIIKATLRILQVIGVGETPVAEDYINCTQALNIMIKGWSNNESPIWVLQNLEIPMVHGTSTYTLGPTGGKIARVDVVTGGSGKPSSGTWTSTGGTTSTNTASGTYTATGGVINSITVTNGGDSYTTTTGFTITFSGGGTAPTYTAEIAGIKMSRPIGVIQAFLRDSTGKDIQLQFISRQQYDILGVKTNAGNPNQFYYDRQEPTGTLYVYNVPDDDTHTLHLRIQRQFYDITDSTDNFDFPEEFFQALKWGLAAELYLEYPVPENIITVIEAKAAKYAADSFDNSVEGASVFFTADQQSGATGY